MEAAAGLAGLMKVISALPLRMAAPNLHFQSLNPHCDLEDFPTVIPVELSELATVASHVSSGLSSFGFGGTNAHVVLEDSAERPSVLVEAPIFKRQSFAWQAQRHALLAKTMRTAEGSQVFLRPFSGKLLELVSRRLRQPVMFVSKTLSGASVQCAQACTRPSHHFWRDCGAWCNLHRNGARGRGSSLRRQGQAMEHPQGNPAAKLSDVSSQPASPFLEASQVGFTSPLVLKQLDTGELTRDVSLQLGLTCPLTFMTSRFVYCVLFIWPE